MRSVAMRKAGSKGPVQMLLAALCVLSLGFMVGGCADKISPAASKKMEGGGGVPVMVARVVEKDVPIQIQVVGNVESCVTVGVKAQVSGELTNVLFHEGEFVRKGDTLFIIDQRMLQSQLNQAQASVAKDQAQLVLSDANLARDQAQEEYARAEAARYGHMLEKGLVSKEQTEQMQANANAVSAAVRADRAAVQSAQAAITSSQAAVENARVLLGYTTIRSPLDGRTGT